MTDDSRIRPWSVLHACDEVRPIADLLECQLSCGMRAYLLTMSGEGISSALTATSAAEPLEAKSLLTAWSEVRHWRKAFDSAGTDYEIMHVHCFPAGMTAARTGDSFVYDVRAFVEQLATASDLEHGSSWMGRSFRVAEHFVLTHASAVVTHTPAMREAAIKRGVRPECVHMIPDPVEVTDAPLLVQESETITVHAPDAGVVGARVDATSEVVNLLSAFRTASENHASLRLAIAPDASLLPLAKVSAESLGIADRVLWESAPFRSGDIVVAGAIDRKHRLRSYAALCASETCVQAMQSGCAVAAADAAGNRAVSPNGEALLWFTPDQPDALAAKLSLLATDRVLRARMADAGLKHLAATRSQRVVGYAYDQLYRLVSRPSNDVRPKLPAVMAMKPAYGAL